MKKAFILLCALTALVCLSSCGAEDDTVPNDPQLPQNDDGDDDFDLDDFDFDFDDE